MRSRAFTVAITVMLVISLAGPGAAAATGETEYLDAQSTPHDISVPGDDCQVGFQDVLLAINAFNENAEVGGVEVGFQQVLQVIEFFNSGQVVPGCSEANSLTVTVTEVVDGDTVDVQYANGTSDTVRLLGVDTPEVYSETSPSEFEGIPDTTAGHTHLEGWGTNASEFVEQEINGSTVTLQFDAQSPRRGYYDRLLAYVQLNETATLNKVLIEQGYARVYESGFSNEPGYLTAESDAQTAKRGLWQFDASTDNSTEGNESSDSDSLEIATVHEDARGDEYDNLDDGYIVFENTGDGTLDLSGWTISDAADHRYTVPAEVTLDAGDTLRLTTGTGTNTDDELYWGQEAPVWNNGGDTVTVQNASGGTVIEYEYS